MINMDQRLSSSRTVRINPDQLRAYRHRKKWTQRDLARASGFTEDYISQLERMPATRNKGTKLETIIRLAQALDVFPTDLLIQNSADESPSDFIRLDFPWKVIDSGPQSSPLLSKQSVNTTFDIRIDPDRLREIRLRKQWTQRDLASASGFSEDYISQLERAPTTRNKGTRLETILKFAQALEVMPLDLLSYELIESLHASLIRRQLLESAVGLEIVELLRGQVTLTAWHEGLQISQEPIRTLA